MAHWYIAPVADTTAEEGGSIAPEGSPAGMERVHAYDPPGAPTTCLVGTTAQVSLTGWTSLTLQQARDHFESFYGRLPLDTEVY